MTLIRKDRTYRGKPTHSYELDGIKVQGVTTLLSKGLPKPALPPWAAKSVAEYVADNADAVRGMLDTMGRESIVGALKGVPWDKRDEAAARGTEIHALAERIIAGEDVEVPEPLIGYVQGYVDWVDAWGVQANLTEVTVGRRPEAGVPAYAGTFDADVVMSRGHLAGKRGLVEDREGRLRRERPPARGLRERALLPRPRGRQRAADTRIRLPRRRPPNPHPHPPEMPHDHHKFDRRGSRVPARSVRHRPGPRQPHRRPARRLGRGRTLSSPARRRPRQDLVRAQGLRAQYAEDAEILAAIDEAGTWAFGSGSYGIDRTIERILDGRKPQPEPEEDEEPDEDGLDLDGRRAEWEAQQEERERQRLAKAEAGKAAHARMYDWLSGRVAVRDRGVMSAALDLAIDIQVSDYDMRGLPELFGIEPPGEDEDVDDANRRIATSLKALDLDDRAMFLAIASADLASPVLWDMDRRLRNYRDLGYPLTDDDKALIENEEES